MIKAPPAAFRAHNPIWAFSPTSGEGAKAHGGRFNPVGLPALYLSLRFETAVLEASQTFPEKMQPLTIVQYDVDCSDIVDLTDAPTRAKFSVSERDLKCPWQLLAERGAPVPSWEIARKLIARGAAGIIVRSFARDATAKDRNLVLWRWGSRRPHKIVAVDDENRLSGQGRRGG